MNITKEKFLAFVRLQQLGVMNMTDIERGAKLTHLTEDEYEEIMWNYTKYKDMYIKNKKTTKYL